MSKYQGGMDPVRLDRGESLYFAREVEHIKTQTYDAKPKELKGLLLIPISTEAGPAASVITFRRYTRVGFAKIIGNYANDFPRVDVFGEEDSVKVYSIGDSYGYNIMEIRQAVMTPGKNLELRRATAARMAHDDKANDLALNGDAEYKIMGIIKYPGITEATLPADGGPSNSTRWKDKSEDQILRDINILTDAVMLPTYNREVPDTLLLPMSVYNHLANKRLGDNQTTLLKYIMDNNPVIKKIDWLSELASAGEGGLDRALIGKFDPEHITLEMPQPFEQFDPIQKGMEYTIPCHTRCAGVIVYYPLAFAFADGI
jgi:hypothetical protein